MKNLSSANCSQSSPSPFVPCMEFHQPGRETSISRHSHYRRVSSTGEPSVDQRIAKLELHGGYHGVLDPAWSDSAPRTTRFPRRNFDSRLSVHFAGDRRRESARENGDRNDGCQQSTTGARTTQIRMRRQSSILRARHRLLFLATVVQLRYLNILLRLIPPVVRSPGNCPRIVVRENAGKKSPNDANLRVRRDFVFFLFCSSSCRRYLYISSFSTYEKTLVDRDSPRGD